MIPTLIGPWALALAGHRIRNEVKSNANSAKLFIATIGFILFHLLN
jgi:hypothetical protein